MVDFGYGKFRVGNTLFPLDGYNLKPSLPIADIPLYWLLPFCAGMLDIYAGDAWTTYCNALGLTDSNQIVGTALPYNPIPWMQDTTFKFPILAMYRTNGTLTEKTISFNRIETNLEVIWIMPPMTAAQAEQLIPFQNSVLEIITDRNEQGWDPNYQDGYLIGQAAGFDSIGAINFSFGNLATNPNEFLPTVQITLRLRERKMLYPGAFKPLTGFDVEEDLLNTDPNVPIYPNFVDFKKDF